MADPQYGIGDGQDNFAGAASNAAKAAGQIGKNAANQAAMKGAEATAKAATAAVKAGVETGKAVSEIAAGTAAGGPWGAAIAAVWAMRHTLFKVLICICLSIVFLIVMVVSLPSIIFNSIFGSDSAPPVENATVASVYADMSDSVSAVIESGYQQSMAQVDQIISDGGYPSQFVYLMLYESTGHFTSCNLVLNKPSRGI